MVLLRGDGDNCDYVILDPEESQDLLGRIQPAKDKQIKINIRIPSLGEEYIQEWRNFPLTQRVISLGKIETESGSLKLKRGKRKVSFDMLLQTFRRLPENERKAIIEELEKGLA